MSVSREGVPLYLQSPFYAPWILGRRAALRAGGAFVQLFRSFLFSGCSLFSLQSGHSPAWLETFFFFLPSSVPPVASRLDPEPAFLWTQHHCCLLGTPQARPHPIPPHPSPSLGILDSIPSPSLPRVPHFHLFPSSPSASLLSLSWVLLYSHFLGGSLKSFWSGVSEMAPQVKVSAAKLDDLSSIPGAHR